MSKRSAAILGQIRHQKKTEKKEFKVDAMVKKDKKDEVVSYSAARIKKISLHGEVQDTKSHMTKKAVMKSSNESDMGSMMKPIKRGRKSGVVSNDSVDWM